MPSIFQTHAVNIQVKWVARLEKHGFSSVQFSRVRLFVIP